MTISTPDLNRLRGAYHSTGLILNATPLIPIVTARTNQSTFVYPLAELAIDDIEIEQEPRVGHLVYIGTAPGLNDVTTGVLRRTLGADVMYIDAKSQGDPGSPRFIHTPLSDDLYVTIFKYRPAWGLLSSIRGGVFYKQWDSPYAGQGHQPPPVAVMGAWRQAFAPVDGTATLSFSAVGSFAWGNQSIEGYQWNLDGGTLLDGYELTDDEIEAEFEPGFYEIECTVTTDLGITRTGYRYLWVNVDDATDPNAPFSYRYPLSITDDNQEAEGRSITLSLTGNIADVDTLYPGQGWLLTESPRFNGAAYAGSDFVSAFVGYSSGLNKVTSYRTRQNTIEIVSPLLLAESIPTATQEMNEVPSPSNWSEVTSALSHPPGAVFYLAAYHAPYLIDGHDFSYDAALLELRRKTFQFKATNLRGQIKAAGDYALALVGNKSDGRLRMVRSPMYLNNTDRNALEAYYTLTPADLSGTLTRAFNYRMQISQVYGYAFSFDGSDPVPYASLAPGYSRSQADGQSSMTPFTVSAALGQDRVNEVTGHEYALQNSPVPRYNAILDRNKDVFEPIDIDRWITLNLPDEYDSEGYGWLSERAIVTRVIRTWSNQGGLIKSIQIEAQPETYGVPGITIPVERGGANDWYLNQWNPGVFEYYQPIMPDLGYLLPVMLAVNSNGILARSFNFGEPQVSWERLNGQAGGFIGHVLDITIDPHSPYFSDPSGNLRFHIITNDSGTLRAYTLEDGLALIPVWTEITGSGVSVGSGFNNKARILVSRETADFMLIVWRNESGIRFMRSTSSTPSLSTPDNIGSVITDSDHIHEDVGVGVYEDSQWVIAPTGGTTLYGADEYKLYTASGTGGFSAASGEPLSPDESAVLGFAYPSEVNRGYVSYVTLDPPTPPAAVGVVTFDTGGQTGYTVIGAGVTTGGNPGNCAWNTFNAAGAGGGVNVGVRCTFLQEQYYVTDIEYDVNLAVSFGSVTGRIDRLKVSAFAGGRLVGSGVPTLRENYGGGWLRYGIRADEMTLSESPDEVLVEAGFIFEDSTGSTIVYAYIDNINITANPIYRTGSRRLYKVNPGVPTWSNITPRGWQLPSRSYALGVGIGSDVQSLSIIGLNDSGKAYLLNTDNGGGAWSVRGRTPYNGLKRAGDLIIAWGYNAIAVSPDIGVTFYPRIGNWNSAIGPVAEIVAVAGILS